MKLRSISIAASLLALAAGGARAQDAPATTASPLTALDDVGAAVVERVAASVVLIDVDRMAATPRRLTAGELERMGLGDVYEPRYFTRPDEPCTGVVIGPGLIATSTWNVDGEAALTVIRADGTRLPARRLGRDENLDVALLAVDAPDLVPLPLASGPPVVGRFLFLIGRTAANAPLVTEGIVSGLNRHRGDSFAHSARTSYQNAGGALVDLDGRLVGIAVRHTDRASQGQSSGVAFGAPAHVLKGGLGELAKGLVVKRRPTPFLGIQFDPRDRSEAGVRIGMVVPGEAAQAAGLKDGDVITVFNSVELLDNLHLREELDKLEIGSEIVITVQRGTQELDVTVKLGSRVREE